MSDDDKKNGKSEYQPTLSDWRAGIQVKIETERKQRERRIVVPTGVL